MNERISAPIGVFDSGVGGLSVLAHMRALLPAEDFFYVADSGYAPYGERSSEFIRERSLFIADFLVARGCKALVVACNTATAVAVKALRERFDIPVVAMEPGIKPAVEITQSNVIGVLATAGTLESARFFSLVSRYAGDVRIVTQPCPGLVERIEANDLNSPETDKLLRGYLEPLLERGADVIVLGCTHYPFLREPIEAIVGDRIAIVDTGPAVARELRRRLEQDGWLRAEVRDGREEFWSSGERLRTQRIYAQLWRASVHVQPL